MKKIKIAVLFGGRSAEHEVSIVSSRAVMKTLAARYSVVPIKIPRQGAWPTPQALKKLQRVDVVFPILHGPFGEDGTVQGLLKLLNLPFVGAGVLGSAVAMDKDVMKRLFREAGIPISKFLVFSRFEQKKISFSKVKQQLGLPVFVKPANMGSSVGISKAKTPAEFKKAVQTAFKYDSKIVIEQNIIGREIECSVLGNVKPIASLPGEIIAHKDFYSYDAKYIDDQGASLKIPATLPKMIIKQVQAMAIKVYKALNCEGMGRVDMFLTRQNKILVNEINTIPGFTPAISMYPKLWAASGLAIPKLLDRLIELALERHREEKKNK